MSYIYNDMGHKYSDDKPVIDKIDKGQIIAI
jgi:hypothetical protein